LVRTVQTFRQKIGVVGEKKKINRTLFYNKWGTEIVKEKEVLELWEIRRV